jgi:hypothetical protein
MQLCRQQFIQHNQLFLLAIVAYVGVIIIALTIAQISNDLLPHNLDIFQGFLVAFVSIFGILFVGHSFPAFRSKERTITYLMIPGSTLEKLLSEFLIRIVIIVVALPVIYWITFHFQGYSFSIFTRYSFEPIGLQHVATIDIGDEKYPGLIQTAIASGILLALLLAFTGSAMFSKQPLVKSLFAVAVILLFFGVYSYFVIVEFGLEQYRPPENMWLIPRNEGAVLTFLIAAFILSSVVMGYVAFRKLKEKEV